MKTLQKHMSASGKSNRLSSFFLNVGNALKKLFQPEEVEVTFKMEGNQTTYTYTVIEQHNAA